MAGLISTTATVKNNYTPTPGKTIAIYLAILVSHVLVNSFGVHILRYLNNTSIILHSLGVGSLAIAVVAKAPTHRSAKEVFGFFNDGTGVNGAEGWSQRASPAYVALCGILVAQYSTYQSRHLRIFLITSLQPSLDLTQAPIFQRRHIMRRNLLQLE